MLMMAAVPDKVLQWLYGVIKNEYHDVDRTYNDAANALANYPSLGPRTEVYTYENGASALLLLISGTLPVNFRGQTYRFPVAIWTPHSYPYDGPIVFVKPTAGMAIRAGQHVGPDGRIYHPYLAQWSRHWDKSSIHDFLVILQDVFAKDPPVISQQQTQSFMSSHPTASPVPPPRPPSIHASPRPNSQQQSDMPPRLPPKNDGSNSASSRYDRPAPLPPGAQQQSKTSFQPLPTWQHIAPGAQNYHLPPTIRQSRDYSPTAQPLPSGTLQNTSPVQHGHWQQPTNNVRDVGSFPAYGHGQQSQQVLPPPTTPSNAPFAYQQQHHPLPPNHASGALSLQYQQSRQQHKQAPIDLLTSPLDVTLPSQNGSLEPLHAPPIPPNPEKDALLHALSGTLTAQTHRTLDSNKSAIAPLMAQQQALLHAQTAIQSEIEQLRQLDSILDTNERVLNKAMHEAEQVMRAAASQRRPQVDELLVCPTVVGSQLYNLVSEQKGCEEARLMLVRGLDRGRVGPDVFVKTVRSLAREEFLKKALLKKAARGMGLDEKRWQHR